MSTISYDEAVRLARSGRFVDAEKMCKRLLKAFPGNFALDSLMSSITLLTGRYEESRRISQRLLTHPEVNADVYNTLAAISADHDGDIAQTEIWLKKALQAEPGHRKALINMGNHYIRLRQVDKAKECYQQATSDNEPNLEAMNGLGMVAAVKGDFPVAIDIYKNILEHTPGDVWAWSRLLEVTARANKIDEALALSAKIVAMKQPGVASVAAFSIAKLYCMWDISDKLLPNAVHEFDKGTKLFTLFLMANLPFLSSHGFSNKKLLDLHRSAAQVFRRLRMRPAFTEYPVAFASSKRIRIGYLSADLRHHVVTRFLRSLINYRDRSKFEIFLYSAASKEQEDFVTESYIGAADHFIRIVDMNDVEAADRIHADGIHILIELGGYTAGARTEVLIYRPAPVQMSYLGYPFSYGLEEVDYVVSDPWLDGPKSSLYFVERLLRLPESFITVDELPEHEIELPVPVVRNGYVTFGSMNNIYKLNVPTIALWSRILHRVPGSKIYLNHPNLKVQATRDNLIKTFARYGVSADRVIMVFEKHPKGGAHVLYYNEIDIALDTFPLTGGTTTVETLWMGVPVITLVGDTHAQRLSYSIIKNVGMDLDDCIAFHEDEYVECAARLAENPQRISDLRQQIPAAMRKGIFGDPVRFTAQMEAAYIEAWDKKFPELPIANLLGDEVVVSLPIGDNSRLLVHDLPDDMYAYILREQGKWFEAEDEFLVQHAGLFKTFWDFAEDPGVFAIPMAKAQSVSGGMSVAVRADPVAISLLHKSIAYNQLKNVTVLDSPASDQPLPDLVRFSLDYNDGTASKIGHLIDIVDASSPLILASLRNSSKTDLSTYNLLKVCGYTPYRLLPGYGLLVPHQDEVIELSLINLFFCKPDTAIKLEQQGILCGTTAEIENIAVLENANLWHESLSEMAYAIPQLSAWMNAVPSGQLGNAYRLALNLDRQGRDQALSPAQRWASIQRAQAIVMSLMQGEITVPRLLSGIRIMADSGRREMSAQWAQGLYENLQGKAGPVFNEPWLAPLKEFEQLPMTDDALGWVRTVAVVAYEYLRSFSSWFTAEQSLKVWEKLSGEALMDKKARSMAELIHKRLSGKN
jgi:predicted O-linked N-acetylglucosamine transferase (SPINDLY family)